MKEFRDWLDVLAKVVLAIAGVVVGYYFSFQKQQNDDIKLIVDMATSTESAKRIMGASIAQTYVQQKRIPQDFFVAVFQYANSTDDQHLRDVVNTGAAAASQDQPTLQQALTRASDALPVRIYFHIRQEEDRPAAQTLEKTIEASVTKQGRAIVVPGIERVPGTQAKSVLKCFKKAECDAFGAQLVELFKSENVPIELSDQSAAYENSSSIRPNHFEAWFAPGLRP